MDTKHYPCPLCQREMFLSRKHGDDIRFTCFDCVILVPPKQVGLPDGETPFTITGEQAEASTARIAALTDERDRLQKQFDLARRLAARRYLCPGHDGKAKDGECLLCEVERLIAERDRLREFCEDVERECAAIYAVMSDPEKRQDRKLQIYTGETAMRLGTRARALLDAPAQGEPGGG